MSVVCTRRIGRQFEELPGGNESNGVPERREDGPERRTESSSEENSEEPILKSYRSWPAAVAAWSSEEGRRADALALGADEGRDKLRKAAGSCT